MHFFAAYRNRKRILWGLFWVLLGVFVLLSNYGVLGFPFEFSRDWPIILIAWGFLKIIDVLTTRKKINDYFNHSHSDKTPYHGIEKIIEAVQKGKVTVEEVTQDLKEKHHQKPEDKNTD